MVQKFTNSQLRYYQNDFALCYKNGIGQTDTSLFEDNTIENVYRIVEIKTKQKIVNITCYLSTKKKKNCNKKCINTEITTGLTQDNCPVKNKNLKVCVCVCVCLH